MSGSVWLLALTVPTLTAAAVGVATLEARDLRQRAAGIADQAALAAATTGCPAAARVAAADGAHLLACTPGPERSEVRITLSAAVALVGAVTAQGRAAATAGLVGVAGLPDPVVPEP